MNGEYAGSGSKLIDRLKIAGCIVRGTARRGWSHDHVARIANHKRITIRLRAARNANHAPCTADVFDYNSAKERFYPIGPWATKGIVHTARGKRND
jgi:hypothetical protein